MTAITRARVHGERRAEATLLRLLCAVSIWRTAAARILPLCGASAWWVTLLCLLPGFIAAALLRLTMRITQTRTLQEAIRACLGRAGGIAVSVLLALLLAVEGTASMTALITLFTQGIGTKGTQLTLALLTGAMLLFSLHREGLPRAAHFLRWGMMGAAALLGACLLPGARLDYLYPLYGAGRASAAAAVKAGFSLAWPVVLLLNMPPAAGEVRLRSAVRPACCAVGALLLTNLTIPHELLRESAGLAEALLLPVRYAPNALRVLAQSLMMLTFFIAIGAAAHSAARHLCAPVGRMPGWLPHGLIGLLVISQAGDVSRLWEALGCIEPCLVLPLLVLSLLALIAALLRRRKR